MIEKERRPKPGPGQLALAAQKSLLRDRLTTVRRDCRSAPKAPRPLRACVDRRLRQVAIQRPASITLAQSSKELTPASGTRVRDRVVSHRSTASRRNGNDLLRPATPAAPLRGPPGSRQWPTVTNRSSFTMRRHT
jgi:hypothetical protein